MSANLDLVRSIYAALERGDYGWVEWADPEVEYVYADGPSPGVWTGLADVADAARDFLGAWEDLRVEVEEYRELDDERVLVLTCYTGRGKKSGLELGQMRAEGAVVFHIRGGKVTRRVHWFDRERAIADLGLAPEVDATDPR
jgi:ketosteroid isomerase-like protein